LFYKAEAESKFIVALQGKYASGLGVTELNSFVKPNLLANNKNASKEVITEPCNQDRVIVSMIDEWCLYVTDCQNHFVQRGNNVYAKAKIVAVLTK